MHEGKNRITRAKKSQAKVIMLQEANSQPKYGPIAINLPSGRSPEIKKDYPCV